MAEEEKNDTINRELLEATLNVIRQSLQADGGDVALIDVDDKTGTVTLEMQGACAGCPLSSFDMSEGIERILRDHVPGVKRVAPAVF
ncbi:MAG: NifU family protein [Atopobiaceae bacterium]|nr:NifU family protein [Atopobiaceae bacterium]